MVLKKTEELLAEIRGDFFLGIAAKRENRSLCPGMPLILIREPNNKADKNAIKVASLYGIPCGYVAREIAAKVAPEIDQGFRWMAKVYSERRKKEVPIALLWKEEDEGKEETKAQRAKETVE